MTAQIAQFKDSERNKIEMVWTCAEVGCRVCWEKSAEDGAVKQERKDRMECLLAVRRT